MGYNGTALIVKARRRTQHLNQWVLSEATPEQCVKAMVKVGISLSSLFTLSDQRALVLMDFFRHLNVVSF